MTSLHPPNAAERDFKRLQAAFKQHGHTLGRSQHKKEVRYFASAWGFCKQLHTLEEVRAFLQQIGGEHASP